MTFSAALIEDTTGDPSRAKSSVTMALSYYNILQAVVLGRYDFLRTSWLWSDEQVALARRFSTALIGSAASIRNTIPEAPDPDEETFRRITFREGASPFEHRMPFFFAALACCYDLAFLLEIFGNLEPGRFPWTAAFSEQPRRASRLHPSRDSSSSPTGSATES